MDDPSVRGSRQPLVGRCCRRPKRTRLSQTALQARHLSPFQKAVKRVCDEKRGAQDSRSFRASPAAVLSVSAALWWIITEGPPAGFAGETGACST